MGRSSPAVNNGKISASASFECCRNRTPATTREALGAFNFAGVLASNSSLAANVLSAYSVAASSANQVIVVSQ